MKLTFLIKFAKGQVLLKNFNDDIHPFLPLIPYPD